MKKSYTEHNPITELGAVIELLAEEEGVFTPTDVLRFARMTECNEMRSIVVSIAIEMDLIIKSSGKGIRIEVRQ